MTQLAASPITEPDLLDELALIADPHTVTRKPLADIFRAACWAEAQARDGWVNPNAVRARVLVDHAAGLVDCDDPEMNHRQYSALWLRACGPNGYLDKTTRPVDIDAKHSRGNGGKATVWRKWRGGVA